MGGPWIQKAQSSLGPILVTTSEYTEKLALIFTVQPGIDIEASHTVLFKECLNYILYLHLLKLHFLCCSTGPPPTPDSNFLLQVC